MGEGGFRSALAKLAQREHSLDAMIYDTQPAHSFATLLDELATLTRNTIVFDGGIQITKLAAATPLQHRAFELIGANIPNKLATT